MIEKNLKYVILILLVAVLLSASACIDLKTLKTEEKVVHVTATIEENEIPHITNVDVSTHTINLLRYPKDVPPNFPGVYVLVIYAGNRVNYWTSVPYTGSGTYEITTGLRFVPADGSEVRVIVTVNDEMGERIAMNTMNVVIGKNTTK